VEFPQEQTCCGQPFSNNGFVEQSRSLGRRMVEIFRGFDYVVTPSGSCCAMVREQYHVLFAGDAMWEGPVHDLSSRTFEFVEFLDKVLKVHFGDFRLPARQEMTYHYTCHLRGLGVHDEGMKLLAQIGNVELKPMEKTDQCCGFGGTFAVKYPAISGAIVQDKTRCIAATGAPMVVCNDAGCSMNISGMCHREGMTTRVTHIAELLAAAMGLDLDGW
jgi:L-lactate dehydrogenase complex protein LldE